MELEFGIITENSKHCTLAARFMTIKLCCLEICNGHVSLCNLTMRYQLQS